ncbi:MAG: PTS glucose transporter subunit IIA [Bacillota bacterium]|nr:PTS glucose transporter subunit IIA [Bacillota bacterium]
MGLFDRFKKKEKEFTVVSPATGVMIPAKEIKDPVFAEEMMGQTIGIVPSQSTVVCPVEGTVEVAFPTGHAFGIKTKEGYEVLVHVGIDTVSMNGDGFTSFLQAGQSVKVGDKAVEIDLGKIAKAGFDPTVMLIVTTTPDGKPISYIDFTSVEKGQKINK